MKQQSTVRVALVTGGAKGIGAEVCRQLAQAGHQVLVADMDLASAQHTAADLVGQGMQARALELNVADAASVASVFEQVQTDWGRCDILVNCAGIAKVYPFLEFPLDNFLDRKSTRLNSSH